MKRIYYLIVIAALVLSGGACSKEPAATSADATAKPPADASAGGLDKLKPEPKPEPKITIPAGTKLRVSLLNAVSSDKSRAGEPFLASLAEPVAVDGNTILAKGTKVRGLVVEAQKSGRVKGRASIALKLTEIVREDGKAISISTKPYTAVAEATKKRDALLIGGGAGVGAALGAIAGGGKGAAIGAAAGGGAGTGAVLATRGKEIHYPPETRLPFTLANPVEL